MVSQIPTNYCRLLLTSLLAHYCTHRTNQPTHLQIIHHEFRNNNEPAISLGSRANRQGRCRTRSKERMIYDITVAVPKRMFVFGWVRTVWLAAPNDNRREYGGSVM
jgi:hypothetical protein